MGETVMHSATGIPTGPASGISTASGAGGPMRPAAGVPLAPAVDRPIARKLERATHPWARKADDPQVSSPDGHPAAGTANLHSVPLVPPLPRQEFRWTSVQYEVGDWESGLGMVANLIDTIARYTVLPVAPRGSIVPLGSRQIFEHPFVWFTGHFPLAFTETERENLREYVDRGGFIVVDDHNHDIDGEFHKTALEEIARAFGPDALQEIPNDHELYSKFFEFDRGPPATTHELNGWGDNLLHRHLFGVYRDERIGLLYSNKDYTSEWSFRPDTKRFIGVDPTRFGVNLVVYALTS